jgi:serine/threonine protein kinase
LTVTIEFSEIIQKPSDQVSLEHSIDLERPGIAPSAWTPTRKHIVLLGIASGMMFMHDVLYRDLKPTNVLLDCAREPRVADFGLSKFVECRATLSQSTRGETCQSMAPEIHLDECFDFKLDVYAFANCSRTSRIG